MLNRLFAVALAGALALAAPAGAETLEDAWDAQRQGDYARAADILGALGAAGDPEALFGLGHLHMDGLAPDADPAEGMALFERAAELGHAPAMNSLGYFKDVGRVGPRDRAGAELWYGRAAARGLVVAKNNLAYLWSLEGRELDAALELALEAVAHDPLSPHYQDTLGWVLVAQGRYREALGPLCEAVRLDPREPILREHYGDALWLAGRRGDARAEWREAHRLLTNPLELSGNGIEALRNFGPDLLASLSERLERGLDDAAYPAPVAPAPDTPFGADSACARLIG